MPLYKVLRTYECTDVYHINANSEDEAVQKAIKGEYESHKSYYGDEDIARDVELLETA